MNTLTGLFIGLLLALAGMLYSHKKALHKRIAIGLFVAAVALSLFLGIKVWNEVPMKQGGGDEININAPNNNGTVIGKQTNNFGQQGRKLSDTQIADLKEAIKPWLNDSPLEVDGMSGSDESWALAKQISDAAGLGKTGGETWYGHNVGIGIEVRDSNPPPPLAMALLIHLRRAGLSTVGIIPQPKWPAADNDKVKVIVFFNTTEEKK